MDLECDGTGSGFMGTSIPFGQMDTDIVTVSPYLVRVIGTPNKDKEGRRDDTHSHTPTSTTVTSAPPQKAQKAIIDDTPRKLRRSKALRNARFNQTGLWLVCLHLTSFHSLFTYALQTSVPTIQIFYSGSNNHVLSFQFVVCRSEEVCDDRPERLDRAQPSVHLRSRPVITSGNNGYRSNSYTAQWSRELCVHCIFLFLMSSTRSNSAQEHEEDRGRQHEGRRGRERHHPVRPYCRVECDPLTLTVQNKGHRNSFIVSTYCLYRIQLYIYL